jgi:hypothetical protein
MIRDTRYSEIESYFLSIESIWHHGNYLRATKETCSAQVWDGVDRTIPSKFDISI